MFSDNRGLIANKYVSENNILLQINDNDLCLLSDKAFEGPKNLKVLMLQNNQLKSLHLDALRTPIQTLSLLDMSGKTI